MSPSPASHTWVQAEERLENSAALVGSFALPVVGNRCWLRVEFGYTRQTVAVAELIS